MESASTILAILAILAISILIVGIFAKIRKTLKRFINKSSTLIDTAKMAQMAMSQMEDLNSITPKSISGGDSLYLSRILKDFPQFDLELAKNKVEECIRLIYKAIQDKDNSGIDNKYNKTISSISESLIKKNQSRNISEIKIHNTGISNYMKSKESCVIKFQVAFEYKDSNSNQQTIQERYELEYVSVIDFGNESNGLGLRCSHCGAPFSDYASGICNYCGNKIVSIINNWEISDIKTYK